MGSYPGNTTIKLVVNIILDETTKPELAQYLHAALFSPKTISLLKAINQCFLKTWPGLTEGFINNHLETSMITTIGHLHMKLQRLQSKRKTTPDTDMKGKCKTNLFYYTTIEPSTTKEGTF